MGIGNGLGKFAEGLANGYAQGIENRRKQEEHDLRLEQARNDKDMRAEIKRIADVKVTPAEAYVVKAPDGTTTIYTDAAMAHDASSTSGGEVTKKIVVGGKQYDTPEEAQTAVEAANSPLAKMRMASDIAMKYSRPDVAEGFMKQYKMGVEANRQDAMEAVQQAQMTGDIDGVLEAYNKRLPNGREATLIRGEDGTVGLQITANGKPVGPPKPFASVDAFFEAAATSIATTPDNALEVWKHKSSLGIQERELGLKDRQVKSAEKVADANVAQTEAQTAQMPEEMTLRRRQVAATETSAAASATGAKASMKNADTAAMGLTMPKVVSGVNDKNEVSFTTTTPVQDPQTRQWGLKVGSPQVVPGMLPTGMARPDPAASGLDAMLMGGGGGGLTPAQLEAQLTTMFPKKNLGPAPTK